jgi:23S rRNA pseudouridine955/2504/2580 synthase
MVTVAEAEADMRLDRWLRRRIAGLSQGRIEKLLRSGQIRVDGGRAKANARLKSGQQVRIPPVAEERGSSLQGPTGTPAVRTHDIDELKTRVLYRDDWVLAIDKPPGLATQGGSGLSRHLDAMLDGLKFDASERPRLVHRLDKETSGVLLLGRSASAAARLSQAFRHRSARKLYWALVVGRPKLAYGRIELPLAKTGGPGFERMTADWEQGKPAVTLYATIEAAGRRAAWLALLPLTGRTHQLRAHCAAIGVPIVGDGKYGGAGAFLLGEFSKKLHLHARGIQIPHPKGGGRLAAAALLPPHMAESWRFLGFDAERSPDADFALFEDAVSQP